MKKSYLLLFISAFLLSGGLGFGSDTPAADTVDSAGLIKYTGTGYTLRVPASWQALEASKITAPVQAR